MIGLLAVLFPLLLLGFMLFMARVEDSLNSSTMPSEVEDYMGDASPEEFDALVREGANTSMRRLRNRVRSFHRSPAE